MKRFKNALCSKWEQEEKKSKVGKEMMGKSSKDRGRSVLTSPHTQNIIVNVSHFLCVYDIFGSNEIHKSLYKM
jgi:hypothetical protein